MIYFFCVRETNPELIRNTFPTSKYIPARSVDYLLPLAAQKLRNSLRNNRSYFLICKTKCQSEFRSFNNIHVTKSKIRSCDKISTKAMESHLFA